AYISLLQDHTQLTPRIGRSVSDVCPGQGPGCATADTRKFAPGPGCHTRKPGPLVAAREGAATPWEGGRAGPSAGSYAAVSSASGITRSTRCWSRASNSFSPPSGSSVASATNVVTQRPPAPSARPPTNGTDPSSGSRRAPREGPPTPPR